MHVRSTALRSLRALCGGALLLAVLPAVAAADEEAAFDALLAQALELQRELAAPPSQEPELVFHVGNDSGLILLELGMWIEGVPGVRRHTYSDTEARALNRGGQHRAFATPATESPRLVRVDFLARAPDAARTDAPVRGQLEQRIAGPGPYALRLEGGGLAGLGTPKLRLSPIADVAQAQARVADFLDVSGRSVAAAFERGRAGVAAAAPAVIEQAAPDGGVTRYNMALDALAAGDVARARATLLELGTAEPLGRGGWSLRDRANLQLGYLELRAGRPQDAVPAFSRVRSPGPESNAALLGLGWARLIPPSAEYAADMYDARVSLRPDDADAAAVARRRTPFRYAHSVAEGARATDVRNALVPWSELIGRDPTDPAVQEGLLAVAYAHDHLGAHEQAQRQYRRALDALGHLRTHYDAALRHVDGGGLAALWTAPSTAVADGWPAWFAALPEPRWWLSDPPNAPPNFYFERLVADPAFRSRLDLLTRYRELDDHLRALSPNLPASDAARSRGAALQVQVQQRSVQLQVQLQALAREALQRQRRAVDRPVAEAAFALARMRDGVERADAGVLP
jgi:tetratricopeptide (TPR) repeat protein